jgi:hypothetical protein
VPIKKEHFAQELGVESGMKAQEIFNDCYDKTKEIVNQVFGLPPSGHRR